MARTASFPAITAGWLLAVCTVLAGCVGSTWPEASGADAVSAAALGRVLFPGKKMLLDEVKERLVPGQTSKAQTLDALGPATVVQFDSGYEVWVYRGKARKPANNDADTGPELVILFTPGGVVQKSRIRPASTPGSGP